MGKGFSATKKYRSNTTIFFGDTKAEIEKKIQYLKTVKYKISCRRKSQLVVSHQFMTNQCCGLAVVFRGFILVKSINITEIFPGLHGFMGKTKTGLAKIIPHLTSSSPFKKRFFPTDQTDSQGQILTLEK